MSTLTHTFNLSLFVYLCILYNNNQFVYRYVPLSAFLSDVYTAENLPVHLLIVYPTVILSLSLPWSTPLWSSVPLIHIVTNKSVLLISGTCAEGEVRGNTSLPECVSTFLFAYQLSLDYNIYHTPPLSLWFWCVPRRSLSCGWQYGTLGGKENPYLTLNFRKLLRRSFRGVKFMPRVASGE